MEGAKEKCRQQISGIEGAGVIDAVWDLSHSANSGYERSSTNEHFGSGDRAHHDNENPPDASPVTSARRKATMSDASSKLISSQPVKNKFTRVGAGRNQIVSCVTSGKAVWLTRGRSNS
eukprot:3348566-Pleurochrysis_carterae.AAC.5